MKGRPRQSCPTTDSSFGRKEGLDDPPWTGHFRGTKSSPEYPTCGHPLHPTEHRVVIPNKLGSTRKTWPGANMGKTRGTGVEHHSEWYIGYHWVCWWFQLHLPWWCHVNHQHGMSIHAVHSIQQLQQDGLARTNATLLYLRTMWNYHFSDQQRPKQWIVINFIDVDSKPSLL